MEGGPGEDMPCFLFKISLPREFRFCVKKQEELEAEFYFYFFVGWLAVEWKKNNTHPKGSTEVSWDGCYFWQSRTNITHESSQNALVGWFIFPPKHLSNEKTWLFRVYRGLYYPVTWGL